VKSRIYKKLRTSEGCNNYECSYKKRLVVSCFSPELIFGELRMCKHTPLLSTVWKEDESRNKNIFNFYVKFNAYLPDWCLQHMSKEREKKEKNAFKFSKTNKLYRKKK